MSTYTVETIVCGYHIYQVVWAAAVDKCCLASENMATFTILTLLLSSTEVLSLVMCHMPYVTLHKKTKHNVLDINLRYRPK